MSLEGTWNLTIDTPIGKQRAIVTVTRPGGTWQGTARDAVSGEQTPLTDLTVDGPTITWRQSITKPLRLNLVYTLTLIGDHLTGKAKAGRLPAVPVTGERTTAA
jgi:hypothetical protein